MTRKPIALVCGVLAFLAAAYLTRQAIDLFRREPGVSARVLDRPWTPQSFSAGRVEFEAPFSLERHPIEFPPELSALLASSTLLGGEAEGLTIHTMNLSFHPGTPTSLDGAADGALNNIRTVPGTLSVNGAKHESEVLGRRAIDLTATISRERGVPLQMFGTVWADGNDLYQIVLMARADQPRASAAWERLRASIRSEVNGPGS